jgi:transglutaminase-like putative cysteine protease
MLEEKMKNVKKPGAAAFIVLLAAALAISFAAGTDAPAVEKEFYAIEINGVVCGYSENSEIPLRREGKDLVQAEGNIFVMLSLLGSEFNSEIKVRSLLDAVTRKASYVNTKVNQGGNLLDFELKVSEREAILTTSGRSEAKQIAVTPDLVIGGDEMVWRLKKEFLENHASEFSCDILEILEEEIQRSTFRRIGEETLELAGKTFHAVIVEQKKAKSGMKIKFWLAPGLTGFLKFEVQNRKVYLTDRKVVDRVKVANMDAAIFTKTNVAISDLQAISYMKLKVKIEPTGFALTSTDLNVPGQKFSGTVKDNVIDGVMEIEHAKYDGKDAPVFPPPVQKDKKLKKYLKPDRLIESDAPELVNQAREITAGSSDSWQAATRLSKWVAENISYAIPGGGGARKTYEIRAGECGAHSMLLAAFCRAVGIPARVVFGAMYTPNFGGGFGQHAWNEIYMDQAGWIPVDSTAFENDFIDSGHIRIGEVISATATSFNGKEIEVLDHKLENPKAKAAGGVDFTPYLGKFANLKGGRTFTVLEKEGNLAVDVPGQMVLPFSREDEQGRWVCKFAPHLYLVFKKNDLGEAVTMLLHQVISLTRKPEPAETGKDTPAGLAPFVGKYSLAAANAEFSVTVQDGRLAVYDPLAKTTIRLQPQGEDGGWLDEFNKNTLFFDKDGQGNITGMRIDAVDSFQRGELAASIIEQTIEKQGLEAGIKQYPALKATAGKEVFFNETSFNQLGYRYLNAGKLNEAIEVFKLNVFAYPGSFNAFDSLAEAYMKNKQNDLAIENCKKSLQLNPKNESALKMLEKLAVDQP